MDGGGSRFGGLLRAERIAAGLTQDELARASRMSVAAIRDLEQGRRRAARPASLTRLAKALGLSTIAARELTQAARAASAGRAPAQRIQSQHDAAGHLRFRVLGPLTAWRGHTQLELGPPRQRAVLGLLAVNAGTPISREALIDALWGEAIPATAINLVQTYVARLRRILEPRRTLRERGGHLASVGTGYCLHATDDELDVLAFRQLIAEADAAFVDGDAAAACKLYDEALSLYDGDPLTGIDFLQGNAAVAKLVSERTLATTRYAESACEAGWHERALPELTALTVSEPFNERAHALLMIALAGSGQQGVALRVYEDMRRRLDDQLGVYPSSELCAAYDRVLRQDVGPQPHVPAS
jgi:DNA-binding SARP family transcriptional activator/transcriptional regulator with XRE-family HTH domain